MFYFLKVDVEVQFLRWKVLILRECSVEIKTNTNSNMCVGVTSKYKYKLKKFK